MSDTKVKPCPFCGGKSRVHQYLGKRYARCNKCKSYSAPYDTEEQAREAWNRRATNDVLV
ncbi:Lar family restriction alleviation protein [uncultured Ruminococcus sp.]|uniref:Lar family restriction alleviation protein n=1 Tax=uncultured Ruminococcus sp. TaxID=165186 RepID=UPI0025E94B38|nr:Lar family restriction alleviation protein [uncultured Ruminococcus sp.]